MSDLVLLVAIGGALTALTVLPFLVRHRRMERASGAIRVGYAPAMTGDHATEDLALAGSGADDAIAPPSPRTRDSGAQRLASPDRVQALAAWLWVLAGALACAWMIPLEPSPSWGWTTTCCSRLPAPSVAWLRIC